MASEETKVTHYLRPYYSWKTLCNLLLVSGRLHCSWDLKHVTCLDCYTRGLEPEEDEDG